MGVGGLVAAGPGIFLPAADRPELVEIIEPTIDDEPVIVQAPETRELEGSQLVGESLVVAPLPGSGDEGAGADGTDDDGTDDDSTDVVCAEGNHGATVSSVAKQAEPGPEHGEAVRAAAQSDCGKDDDASSTGDDTPSADDDASSVGDDAPSADDDASSADDDAPSTDDDTPSEPKGQNKGQNKGKDNPSDDDQG
ncbi:MAG: hypothetical protein HKN41_02610 [Ilumatobacter sp.]|nr:hypothetical protein [Ilumatobacter sp.]